MSANLLREGVAGPGRHALPAAGDSTRDLRNRSGLAPGLLLSAPRQRIL